MSNAESSCSVPSSSPSPCAVPSNIPVPYFATTETTSFAPPTPVTPLRAPRDLSPRQFRRHMSTTYPTAKSFQTPRWYISASVSSISHIQRTWIPTCRQHRIRILHGHRLFPTIEKTKDNPMTMRGESTLSRIFGPMIPRHHKTTRTTSPQKNAKEIMQSQRMYVECKLKK